MKKAFLVLFVSLFSLAGPTKVELPSHAMVMKAKTGEIKFIAVGKPGFLKIKGESKGVAPQGSLKLESNLSNGEFVFDLNSLNTGIDLRDEHMKDKYLEVKKFPQAKLILKDFKVTTEELNSDFEKSFSGSLILHGETKNIDGKIKFIAKDKSTVSKFTIKVSDFKIDVPQHLGITVSETVDIEVHITFE